MKKVFVVVSVMVAVVCSAADLKQYQATYDKNLEEIVLSNALEFKKLEKSYGDSLSALLKKVQKSGDLDKYSAVEAEVKRYESEKTVKEADLSKDVSDLTKLQKRYISSCSSIDKNQSKDIMALTGKYDAALVKLQKLLTTKGDIPGAKEVQEERKKVQENPNVVAAKEMLAKTKKAGSKAEKSAVKAKSNVAFGVNLIANPSAEQLEENGQLADWVKFAGKRWCQRGANPGPQDGIYYFFPGAVSQGELRQEIDVSKYRFKILKGKQKFKFSGYTSSWTTAVDSSRVIIEYLDKGKKRVLSSFDSGVKTSSQRWVLMEDERVAPPQTGYIRIRLISVRNEGNNCDGCYDNLSLVALDD